MVLAPVQKFLILCELSADQLIEHVLGGFIEKRGVRVQRLVVLPIELRNVPNHVLAARAPFDQRHLRLLSPYERRIDSDRSCRAVSRGGGAADSGAIARRFAA